MARLILAILGMLAVNGVTSVQGQVEPGGYQPIDVDSDDAKNAALLGVSYFEAEDSNTYKLVLVRIIEAEEQIVAGTNVNVTFELGVTKCLKDDPAAEESCPFEENTKTRTCNVVVYTNLQQEAKITESNCDVDPREPKQLEPAVPPGGYYPIDVDSEDAKEAAKFAVSELQADPCNSHQLALIKIVQAEEQVVAGTNTNVSFVVGTTKCLKNISADCPLEMSANTSKCNAVVYTPLEGRQKITKLLCDIRLCDTNTIPPGGYYPIDVDSEDAKKAAKFAVSELQADPCNSHQLVLIKIVQAEEQIVAGKNTHVALVVGATRCLKNISADCGLEMSANTSRCLVVVYTPLEGRQKVTESYCDIPLCDTNQLKMTKTGSQEGTIPGGESEVNVHDSTLKRIAKFALHTVDEQSNHLYSPKLDEILKARIQVVAGALYTLEMRVGFSKCDNCQLTGKQLCTVEVWDIPWLQETKLMSYSCALEL